jgi:hypothetical protein
MFINKLSGGQIIEISDEITFEEFLSAINTWNEKTTTSPSGRHLGHYKLMTRLNVPDKTNDKFNINEKIMKVCLLPI